MTRDKEINGEVKGAGGRHEKGKKDPLEEALEMQNRGLQQDALRQRVQAGISEDRLRQVETEHRIKAMEEGMYPGQPTSPGYQMTPRTTDSKEELGIGKLLTEIWKAEKETSKAAQEAQSAAEQKMWETQQKYLEGMMQQIQAERAKPVQEQKSQIEIYREYNTLFGEWQDALLKNMPKPTTHQGLDGTQTVQLEQLRLQHERDMEIIKAQNAKALQDGAQHHDIAMEEARLARMKFEIEIEQIKQSNVHRQDGWSEVMGQMTRVASDVLTGGPEGEGLGPRAVSGGGIESAQVGRTRANLAIYQCTREGCGFNIPVSPEVEAANEMFTCPKCATEYFPRAPAPTEGMPRPQGPEVRPHSPPPTGEDIVEDVDWVPRRVPTMTQYRKENTPSPPDLGPEITDVAHDAVDLE